MGSIEAMAPGLLPGPRARHGEWASSHMLNGSAAVNRRPWSATIASCRESPDRRLNQSHPTLTCGLDNPGIIEGHREDETYEQSEHRSYSLRALRVSLVDFLLP